MAADKGKKNARSWATGTAATDSSWGQCWELRWWEQRVVGREIQECPKASELWLDLAEAQGSAGAGRHGPVLLHHPSSGCSGG